MTIDWQEISGNWVLIPPRPVGIIHFLGGAFIAAAPNITYRSLLEHLSERGYVVVATPFINMLDHVAIAQDVLRNFEQALHYLQSHVLRRRYLPIYGLGHSMGCKLHLLIGSLFSVKRAGNMLLAFNNFPARRSIPLVEQLSPLFEVEFSPSPRSTQQIIVDRYQIRRNLLIQFARDDIDQTPIVDDILQQRFPGMVSSQILPGNHLTPLSQSLNWQPGRDFSPLDALGQWIGQSVSQDLNQLKRTLMLWLDPLSPP